MSQQGSRFNQAVSGQRGETAAAPAAQQQTAPQRSYTPEQQALGMSLLLEVAQNTPNSQKITDLIARGAALEIRNAHDSTPLLIAARKGQEYIADLLIQAGADVNAKDSEGNTPLILATISGSVKTVRNLTDKNAAMDQLNMLDRSALMWAAALGRREIAQILIRRGADLEQHNHAGQTAYDIARMHENFSLAEILKAGVQQQKDAANARPVTPPRAASYKDLLGKA
ncbi:MAG TPA: ankyrin repeat domain-containing protein [Alphaproteobacteria bacterium]|nr:ankyrin repeat domain-containing protein [Alphaproteobacteria bacterium]